MNLSLPEKIIAGLVLSGIVYLVLTNPQGDLAAANSINTVVTGTGKALAQRS